MKRLIIAAFALLLLSCTTSSTETIVKDEDSLEKGFEEIMQRHSAVGLQVAAVKDGQIVYTESFGYKNLEEKTPIENGDVLRIASISKTFYLSAFSVYLSYASA